MPEKIEFGTENPVPTKTPDKIEFGEQAPVGEQTPDRTIPLHAIRAFVDWWNQGGISGMMGMKPVDVQMEESRQARAAAPLREQAGVALEKDPMLFAFGPGNIKAVGGLPRAPAQINPVLEAMGKEGVTPRMAGDVTGSRLQRGTTAMLQNAPVTGGIIQKAAKETTDEIAAAVGKTARKYGPGGTPTEAGEAITRGVGNYAKRVSDIADNMYERLNRVVPEYKQVPLTETLSTVTNLTGTMPNLPSTAKHLTPTLFQRISDDLASGTPKTWRDISRLRTEVGKQLGDPMLIDDIGRADLKRLYTALTSDMKSAASQIGPKAVREFERSNTFYRKQMEFLEGAFQKFNKAGVSPENFYQWATAEGRTGATRLQALRKAMGPEEFGVVSATVLKRLGAAADKPFDANAFIANWERLSPEAKKTLFSGPGWNDYAQSVDRIALIARSSRETSRLANTSRTAGTAQLLSWIGAITGAGIAGAPGAAAGVGAAIGLQAGASKLLTSPAFTRWLAKPVEASKLPPHIAGLAAVVQKEPDLKEPVQDLLRVMQESPDGG